VIAPRFQSGRTRICIIRHGETDWNVEKRIQGHTDVPLNEVGRAQALAMAFNAAHQRFDAIYSSDLARTLETARALAQREDQEVKLLPQLRERHYGFSGPHRRGACCASGGVCAHVARDLITTETGESLRSLPIGWRRASTGWCGIAGRRSRRSATAGARRGVP
jgi:probable phosphoglycerate mutase